MPSDNVEPCPHCNGTGEQRFEWWVCCRYQDGSDWHGPYHTEAEAQGKCSEYDDERHGYLASVVKQVMPHTREETQEEPEECRVTKEPRR